MFEDFFLHNNVETPLTTYIIYLIGMEKFFFLLIAQQEELSADYYFPL